MSPSLRRLMKEASELASSPSPHFCAQPVSESNLYDWHFTLAGPPEPSPYAGGIYHGRIVLPPTYPLRPPSFRFLTPSGRFEVNREICLSISGHHEETWQPAWGIRTALLAIRSFMEGNAKGQVGGLDVSEEVRRDYAIKSRGWCCDVCEGGKSNEEILREWREVCRSKGVEFEDGEKKDAQPSQEVTTNEDQNKDGSRKEEDNQKPQDPSNQPCREEPPKQSQHDISAIIAPSSTIEPPPNPTPFQPQPRQQQPARVVSSPNSQSSIAAPSSSQSSQPQPIQPVAFQAQSSGGPWLDRAIVGVLVALVFMILRRLSKSDDYMD